MPWPVLGPAGELPDVSVGIFECDQVPDDKARKAAEALSGAALTDELSEVKATVKLHTWTIGAVFVMNVAILVRLLVPN